MCTAVSYNAAYHYFGRNLDIECSYGEKVIITPRNYVFEFREKPQLGNHYAIIGIGAVEGSYPLYYDAVNEKGLGMAGLRFADAIYNNCINDKDNIASFEAIPWILGQCQNVDEAVILLNNINITDADFSNKLPPSPLHWLVSDKSKSVTMECEKGKVKIYENPCGVLTNMPRFDFQIFNLNNYINLSVEAPRNKFGKDIKLYNYSRGMGAMGLPGDLSSMSRFVKAVFTKYNSIWSNTENEDVAQFFHILGSVCQQKGCTLTEDGKYEYTLYSSCCNTDTGIYYYTTYSNSQINAVDMNKENLDDDKITEYPLKHQQSIIYQN